MAQPEHRQRRWDRSGDAIEVPAQSFRLLPRAARCRRCRRARWRDRGCVGVGLEGGGETVGEVRPCCGSTVRPSQRGNGLRSSCQQERQRRAALTARPRPGGPCRPRMASPTSTSRRRLRSPFVCRITYGRSSAGRSIDCRSCLDAELARRRDGLVDVDRMIERLDGAALGCKRAGMRDHARSNRSERSCAVSSADPVDAGHAVITPWTQSASLYVGMTCGRLRNHAHVVTDGHDHDELQLGHRSGLSSFAAAVVEPLALGEMSATTVRRRWVEGQHELAGDPPPRPRTRRRHAGGTSRASGSPNLSASPSASGPTRWSRCRRTAAGFVGGGIHQGAPIDRLGADPTAAGPLRESS